MKPLNPLTDFARGELKRIAEAPVPGLEINAGVMDRLRRGGLVELVMLRSPYKTHKVGQEIQHARITDAGRKELGLPKPKPERKARESSSTPRRGRR